MLRHSPPASRQLALTATSYCSTVFSVQAEDSRVMGIPSDGDGEPAQEECNAALRRHRRGLLRKKNVVGVGVGKKVVGGEETDELCVTVFVKRKQPRQALKAEDIIPEKLGTVRTDVVETGEFAAHSPL